MRTKLIFAVIMLQVLALAYMAGEREWILRHGQTVILRTAPIDPSDVMRGEYVRLNYDIAQVPAALCRGAIPSWLAKQDPRQVRSRVDQVVYAKLRLTKNNQGDLEYLSDEKPAEGLFLRGRVVYVNTASVNVRFGVEAFFMQQGEAAKMEEKMRGEKAGVPLSMEMAVGKNGVAVLKGYHWEPLGLRVTFGPARRTGNGRGRDEWPGILEADVEIKNHSQEPVAIVTGGPCQGLRLVPGRFAWSEAEPKWVWVGADAVTTKVDEAQVRVLAPGAVHKIHLDLAKSEWFVRKTADGQQNTVKPLSELRDDWSGSFRLEYVAPDPESCAGLKDGKKVWQGRLQSRMFSPAGAVD